MSLAKYLLIVDRQDDPPGHRDVAAFLEHLLLRIEWHRDVHFQTCTTIDTLDYSGSALNEGSKVVMAALGPPRRELPAAIEGKLRLPRFSAGRESAGPASWPWRARLMPRVGNWGGCRGNLLCSFSEAETRSIASLGS